MKKNSYLFLIILYLFLLFIFTGSSIAQEEKLQTESSWSSIDDVFINQEKNFLLNPIDVDGSIKIGFTVKEVQKIMGIPDKIDIKKYIYYYRKSPVYFNNEWKVQSWDNRYGNLRVTHEMSKISLGAHISEVFKEKGFPQRAIKLKNSYQLEYSDSTIYFNHKWNVEAIQEKNKPAYRSDRENMSLDDFLEEYHQFLE